MAQSPDERLNNGWRTLILNQYEPAGVTVCVDLTPDNGYQLILFMNDETLSFSLSSSLSSIGTFAGAFLFGLQRKASGYRFT
ncbi:hypothetical protein [Vampirovibrio sp.]|uniref:hypothetical protein n=1 Tax=Vampirovibrio sp. TaxID=2717857 RepID=UPI003592FFE6